MAADAQAANPYVALRRARLERLVDLGSGVGLEVGPLDAPVVTSPPWDVRYVDVRESGALREHYRDDPNVSLERIVEVDFPLERDGTIRTIAEAAAPCAPYRWAVASHVVEHVPDLIGWLDDVASLLEDRGPLFLVVPDRRFSFDAIRPATTVGQLLEANTRHDRRPSERAAYDHFRSAVDISAADLWAGADPRPAPRAFTFEGAVSMRAAALRGEYVDSHVWVVTPSELVAQLADLGELDRLEYTLEHVLPTVPGELEFTVVLRRLPRGANADRRLALRRAALAALAAQGNLDDPPPPPPRATSGEPEAAGPITMEVSPLEARLIGGKRAAMQRLRALRTGAKRQA